MKNNTESTPSTAVNKIESISKVKQLYETLKREIIEGKYTFGEKLPSIRALSERYGMSKNTVNTAIAMLSNERLVNIREGNGTFVGAGTRSVHMIGVMLLDFIVGMRVEIDILSNIQKNLPNNYFLHLMNTSDRYDVFCDSLRMLRSMKVSGYLVVPPKGRPSAEELTQAVDMLSEKPVVMINRNVEGLKADLYSIDLAKGIEKAFGYFNAQGKRSTAIILHDSARFVQEEMRAYANCCERYGLESKSEHLIDYSEDIQVLSERMSRLLPDIDSLIAPDSILYKLNDFFTNCGKAIPTDLSLVGINDTAYSRMFNPPLTSIAFPSERIGRHAIKKLIKRIEGSETGSVKSTNYEPEFIIRNT